MYSTKYVVLLIAAFLAAMFSPLIYNAWAGSLNYVPKLEKPQGECIEDANWMAANHMLLLKEWRGRLREAAQYGMIYYNSKGKPFYISINTCWSCHTSKKDFCDKCHNFVGIQPECWDCHYTPSFDKPKYKGVEHLNEYYSYINYLKNQ